MARLARSVFPGYPHHVVQRGSHDQPVFEAPTDYLHYLEWFQEYITRYRVEVWAYCLMPNHVHFACVPKSGTALARVLNNLHMRYAQYFNGKRGASGQLWRPRFMSCAMDGPSVREEIRFIESNPVRSGLAAKPEEYAWSSARAHVLSQPDPILSDDCPLTAEITDWRGYLSGRGEEAIVQRTRERLRTGRPAGDMDFVRKLEAIAGRRLGALPRGRPRKSIVQRTA
jgi:putative transposase